ncbi:unnamed protein product, partial [Symbiodinium necroappetens]
GWSRTPSRVRRLSRRPWSRRRAAYAWLATRWRRTASMPWSDWLRLVSWEVWIFGPWASAIVPH